MNTGCHSRGRDIALGGADASGWVKQQWTCLKEVENGKCGQQKLLGISDFHVPFRPSATLSAQLTDYDFKKQKALPIVRKVWRLREPATWGSIASGCVASTHPASCEDNPPKTSLLNQTENTLSIFLYFCQCDSRKQSVSPPQKRRALNLATSVSK